MSKTQEALKLALEQAYLAGFNASADGYNGECGVGNASQCTQWLTERDNYIREALAEQPAQPYPDNFIDALKYDVARRDSEAQQQEPVAWATQMGEYAHIHWGAKRPEYPVVYKIPLYTSPPAQQWTDETANVPDRVWDEKCVAGHCGWPSGCADSERCRADNTPAPQSETQGLSQRKPLTDDEIYKLCRNEGDEHSTCFIFNKDGTWSVLTLARAIEAAHGIKGDA